MGAIVERLLAKSGRTPADLPRNTVLGRAVRGRAVPPSREIQRILELPTRRWLEDPELPEIVEAMTEWHRKPGGTETLLPQQAYSLFEAWMYGGVLEWLPVGTGKTLLSFLLPVVTNPKRPLLLVPAKLAKEKTEKELEAYRENWNIPEVRIMSYEMLSTKDGEKKLRRYEPTCICADEAHKLKNKRSARTRKFSRFMSDYPDTPFFPLTGTPLGGGLKGAAHLFDWALPPAMRPLPQKWTELQEWADCLDFKVPSLRRLAPGALSKFCRDADEASSMDGVRSAIGRRLTESPGVITMNTMECAASISIEAHVIQDYNAATEEAFTNLHDLGETPDGHTFAEASQSWAYQHQFASNFFIRWNPPAPKPWKLARKDWHAQAREIINTNRRGLDSELMVANAIDRGEYDARLLKKWRELKPTFTPNPEAVWIDDNVLKFCAKWLHEPKQKPGICWVYNVPLGVKLQELTGVPYYGAGGLDSKGNSIENHQKGPCILSIEANRDGRNLERFDRNLVTYWPSTAEATEQMMGRTHRRRQMSDHVSFEILIGARVQWDNVQKARDKARIELQKSTIQQKILLSDWLVPNVNTYRGARWRIK